MLLLSLALCLLAGCASSADGSAEAAGGGSGLSAALLEEAARPLAEEEILAAYDRALEAYGWFYLETLPTGQEAAAIGGWIYHRVDYPGMETLADLRAYLRGSFTEELTDELLSTGGSHPLYQDVEGELYVLPSSRDRDSSKGQITVGVEPYGQAGYSVMVSVDLLDAGGTDVRGYRATRSPMSLWRTAGSSRISRWSTELPRSRPRQPAAPADMVRRRIFLRADTAGERRCSQIILHK